MNVINELQRIEENLQEYLYERNQYEIELFEINQALKELQDSEEAYIFIGNILLKKSKEKITKILNEKKKILEARIKSIKDVELSLIEKANKLRKELGD